MTIGIHELIRIGPSEYANKLTQFASQYTALDAADSTLHHPPTTLDDAAIDCVVPAVTQSPSAVPLSQLREQIYPTHDPST
jgi:hypothetical protein